MRVITVKSLATFLIAGVIFISLPIVVFFTFRFYMSRLITRDNAGILFDQFQKRLDKGSIVRDRTMAGDVAESAYRERMGSPPMDGWGKPFRVSGEFSGSKCILTASSAGPDGAFGTADDVSIQRNFELPAVEKRVATSAP